MRTTRNMFGDQNTFAMKEYDTPEIIESELSEVYIKIDIRTNTPVYAGMGNGNRVLSDYRKHAESWYNELVKKGFIRTCVIYRGRVGQCRIVESIVIKIMFNVIANKIRPTIKKDILDRHYDDVKNIIITNFKKENIVYLKGKDVTPSKIIDEIINFIPFHSLVGGSHINVCGRLGEWRDRIEIRYGTKSIENNLFIIDKDVKPMLDKMKQIDIDTTQIRFLNDSFENWNEWSSETFDVGMMNPPFEKYSQSFISMLESHIKNDGYMGIVVSPYWRSIKENEGVYGYLNKTGKFLYMHMYTDKESEYMFNSSIGNVDVFVWKKINSPIETKIINRKGEEFYADCSNYPQSIPVLPPSIYDLYFDQINGIDYDIKSGGFGHCGSSIKKEIGRIFEYTDVITNCVMYGTREYIKPMENRKKIIVDRQLKEYYDDCKGDSIGNGHQIIYLYDNEDDKKSIMRTLDFIIDNKIQELFIMGTKFKEVILPKIKRI